MILGVFSVSIPNLFIIYGYGLVGIKLLRFVCCSYIIFAIPSLFISSGAYFFINIIPVLCGAISLLITHAIRFQVLAFYREKMMGLVRERVKLNKEIKQIIKDKRRSAGL